MDAAKLKVLQAEGYSIAPSCGFCHHRSFMSPATQWGTCTVIQYEHQKHTGAPRQLSIHRGGHCSRFELDRVELDLLGGFGQLFTGAGAPQEATGAPVVPFVSAAGHSEAMDVKYDELARSEAMGMLRRAIAQGEAKPLANVAIAMAFEDGCIGTMIPNNATRAVQMLAAVSHLQYRINSRIMEPASRDFDSSDDGG